MDKDRIKGAAKKVKGRIERAVGKLVGNRNLETDGTIDEATGNVRKAVGEAKDVVRDAVRDRTK